MPLKSRIAADFKFRSRYAVYFSVPCTAVFNGLVRAFGGTPEDRRVAGADGQIFRFLDNGVQRVQTLAGRRQWPGRRPGTAGADDRL